MSRTVVRSVSRASASSSGASPRVGRSSVARGRAARTNTDGFAEALQAQRSYLRSLNGGHVGLIIAPSFVRSIRRSGYLNTATAIYELIDNSVEARARNIHIIFGFAESSAAKPTSIAILDDGHGMDPAMLRIALAWGGTHRENGRAGFGRFGYGLPTASMSQGQRFSVLSQIRGRRLYRATFDLEDLSKQTRSARELPVPVLARLPAWLDEYVTRYGISLGQSGSHGTAVIIEKLDNLSWKTAVALERNLDRAIGVTYRNFLGSVGVLLQGRKVTPIDPLFATPGARYYDVDGERAVVVPWAPIEIHQDRQPVAGEIKIRAAYFPPTFTRIDKSREATGLNANARFAVMKDNNGLIVLRNGRQVDVVSSGLWTQFQNNDRYWAVELDFPAQLDEWFSITTNKQRVNLTDSLKEALKRGRLPDLIEELRSRYKADRRNLRPQTSTHTPLPSRPANGHIRLTALPDGTFYVVGRSGEQVVLNEAHPFYRRLYSRIAHQPDAAAAVDAIISILARAEAEADPDGKRFYRQERRKWSERLATRLAELDD